MARKSKTKKRRTMDELLEEEEKEEVEEETEDSSQETEELASTIASDAKEILSPVEPPVPQVQYYDYKTAMRRVESAGIKVCRGVWDPSCFLTDKHRRVNGRGAVLPWNPGREDKNATDWMDFAARLQGVEVV